MAVWPHQPQFPHRVGLVAVGCTIAAGGAFLWPGLSASQRPLMFVAAFYGVASGFLTYGIVLMLLRFVPSLHRVLAFFLFYGALASIAVFLVELIFSAFSGARPYPMQEAISFAVTISGGVGVAAAAFGAINRRVVTRESQPAP